MPKSLRIIDYSDRELIHVMNDVSDKDGWAWSDDICEKIGLVGVRKRQCLGARLARMKMFGAVERHPDPTQLAWRLSGFGEIFLNGDLTPDQRRMLARAKPEQMVMLTRHVTREFRQSKPGMGQMIKREWTHGTARR